MDGKCVFLREFAGREVRFDQIHFGQIGILPVDTAQDSLLPNRVLVGSVRSAPWKGIIHPGYSGGRVLISSSCLISSGASLRSMAARLSFSWSSRLAPMMMDVTTGLANNQARDTRAALQPCTRDRCDHVEDFPGSLLVHEGKVEL